jgi:hypothetical protein
MGYAGVRFNKNRILVCNNVLFWGNGMRRCGLCC